MIEHIVRRMHEPTAGDIANRVRKAADEFTRPLDGSSAATIVVFAPLAFLSGVTGAFFKALSLTMAASLFISFVVAWLAVPILSARALSEEDAKIEDRVPFAQRIQHVYERLMRHLLARPSLTLLFILPLLVAGGLGVRYAATGFMPTMDEGGFILDYKSPPGTSLGETDRLLRQVETILRSTPEVQTYSRRTGLQLGGGVTEANTGDFFIRLKPLPRPGIEEVMDEVRSKITQAIPGLQIEVLQLMEDLIGDLTSVPQPIEIKLYSDDEATLHKLAVQVAEMIPKFKEWTR